MTRKIIDTGVEGNPATGDTLRTAMGKINANFLENYTALADTALGGMFTTPFTNGDIKIQANGTGIVEIDRLSINNTTISSLDTNADITLTANGTGGIILNGPVTATELTTNNITSNGSNADLTLTANGTGNIVLGTSVSMSSTLAVTGQTTLGTLVANTTTLGVTTSSSLTATDVTTNTITSNGSNANISIQASGTGSVVIGALTLNGSTISATDSTQINLDDAVQLEGNVGFHGTTPVAQQSAISYTSDGSTKNDVAIQEILTVLRNYGLIAS